MNLNEIFTSTVNLTWKQESPDSMVAEFEVNEKRYECFIEAGTYTFESKQLKFLNVGFSRIVGSKRIFDVTLDTPDSIKVLGAVINGISKKINDYKTDAVMLGATKNIKQRMRIYQWIARKFSNKFGIWIESVKTPNGEATLLISSKLDKDLVDNFEAYIKSQNIKKQ